MEVINPKPNSNENSNKNSFQPTGPNWTGLAIVIVGIAWIIKIANPFLIPAWVFTWPMLLILLGIVGLIKHRFSNGWSYITLFVGIAFLLKRQFDLPFEIEQFIWPALLILLGFAILFKPKRKNKGSWSQDDNGNWFTDNTGNKNYKKGWKNKHNYSEESSDIIDSNNILGASRKDILSKNFKGGNLVNIMGGTEINLTNADIETEAHLNVENIMGGIQLIVPPHWDVQMNTTNILGGIEDKRNVRTIDATARKLLIVTGTVLMGGIEIKTF